MNSAATSALFDLLDELRGAQFNIGLDQYGQVQDLMLLLAARGAIPTSVSRWKTLLRPIVCTSPEEQDEFDRRFDHWAVSATPVFARLGSPAAPDDAATPVDDAEPPEELPAEEISRATERRVRGIRMRPRWVTLVSAFVAVFMVMFLGLRNRREYPAPRYTVNGTVTGSHGPLPAAEILVISSGERTRTDGQGSFSVTPEVRPVRIIVSAEGYATSGRTIRVPQDTPIAISLRPARPVTLPLAELARSAAAVLTLVLVLLGWWKLRRISFPLALRKKSTSEAPESTAIRVQAGVEGLFATSGFHGGIGGMRGHRSTPTPDLDIDATVKSTARAGGLFTPVYRDRAETPEYLVLIDRASFRDQQTRTIDEIVSDWSAAGLAIRRFYFDRDPRACWGAEPGSRPLHLRQLAARYNAGRLILFTDGAEFVDPLTGALAPWIGVLGHWPEQAIFSPDLSLLGPHRQALGRRRMTLLPLSADGFSAYGRLLGGGGEAPAARLSWPAPRPPLLAEQPFLWQQQLPPAPALRHRLAAELRGHLDAAGFFWLCACAVYPALDHNLTLYLGRTLRYHDEPLLTPERLLALTALPWFRHGSIPNWLREDLVSLLPRAEEAAVRQALEALLLTAAEPRQSGFALDISTDESRSLRQVLRTLSGGRRGSLHDRVFLSVMVGPEHRRLWLALPEALRPMLRPASPLLRLVHVIGGSPAAIATAVGALLERSPAAARSPATAFPGTASVTAGTSAEHVAAAQSDGRVSQDGLLLVLPVRTGYEDELASLLAEVQRTLTSNDGTAPLIPFSLLKTVHFARVLLQPATAPDVRISPPVPRPPIPARLVFATDFDGPLGEHVDELLRVAAPGLDRLLAHCEGWPGSGDQNAARRFLLRHQVPAGAFYAGAISRTVSQIQREEALRREIEGFLDREAEQPGFPTDPLAIRDRIRTWVRSHPDLTWAWLKPGPFPKALVPIPYLQMVMMGTVLAVFAASAAAVTVVTGNWSAGLTAAVLAVGTVTFLLLVTWTFLRRLEATDPADDLLEAGPDHLVQEEDDGQNQVSGICWIKEPVWFRRMVLSAVLGFTRFSARYLDVQGRLAGIGSVHFARWAVVDEGRRLLFLSSYDGTRENLLGGVVDMASSLVTAVWSNCVGFPRTRNLVEQGARDEQRFKAFARSIQLPAQVRYHAYPHLSVDNINNNSLIRLGLFGEMTASQARRWLRRFGGGAAWTGPGSLLPRAQDRSSERTRVELDDIQGLVARSFGVLRHAAYIPIHLPADPAAARKWLAEITGVITTASVESATLGRLGGAVNLALTHAGLRHLGLDDASLGTFSREFIEGMAVGHRSRLLGDEGESAPDRWQWGGPGSELHGMLFVFADQPGRLSAILDREEDRARRYRTSLGRPLGSSVLPGEKEHFGFRLGISQPQIAGFGQRRVPDHDVRAENVIRTGEVVLGYPNEYGLLPQSPTVAVRPGVPAELPLAARRPSEAPHAPDRLDLGKNGSYVVFRQLEQHVQAFWRFLDEQAGSDRAARERLAAKMVGRWPNGASLVTDPDSQPAEFEHRTANTFRYSGQHGDPQGDKCPLGSHIRRMNPRDGMPPGPAASLLTAGRHRLVRRSRAYGEPVATSFNPADILASDQPDSGRGLHFICLNTDLSRHFEFVQSAWANNTKLNGLYADPDPLIGARTHPHETNAGHCPASFTEQRLPVRRSIKGLPSFVTTVGGAYLFMPGLRALRYLSRLDDSVPTATAHGGI